MEFNEELKEEWKKYDHLFERDEICAKTQLLQEGEISKKTYLVEKSCLRIWFNNNGVDVTFQFFFEGDRVSSIESFCYNQPSLFHLESIEPSTIRSISKNDLEFVLSESPIIKREIENLVINRILFYQKLFLSRIKDNPQKRYQELLKENPEIILRVPQHYIASYLGITPVSLSRIRNRK